MIVREMFFNVLPFQFLGPAMQEEVLKLVLLALEEGSALSRKVSLYLNQSEGSIKPIRTLISLHFKKISQSEVSDITVDQSKASDITDDQSEAFILKNSQIREL